LLNSWVSDPLEWVGDVFRESDTTRILLIAQGIPTKKSSLIPVPNPQQTQVTSLTRIGGNGEMQKDNHVRLDTPALNPGTVQVVLFNLDATHPPGQYLGFVYDDQRLIAYVVALR
jgi:hypothetical protein